MSDDFYKGTRNDQSDVSNHSEFYRGEQYQREANAPRSTTSPHGSALPNFGSSGGGMVITGESPILKAIVSIPFLIVGTTLYPVTAALTIVAGLLCVRLVPLFGPNATWTRWLAYLPMLVVFWFCMRWDQRMGERHQLYRRIRHVARLVVFALIGYALAGRFMPAPGGQSITLPKVAGALAGAALGHWFLMRGEGWRNFWHRTLALFRLMPAS
ncbi:MAG: hypothetical protein M3081_02910 [Gemmatimonadota bacterium]|nr:hypothetical protein [Gemmatimonadota bacterium]